MKIQIQYAQSCTPMKSFHARLLTLGLVFQPLQYVPLHASRTISAKFVEHSMLLKLSNYGYNFYRAKKEGSNMTSTFMFPSSDSDLQATPPHAVNCMLAQDDGCRGN